MRVVIIGASGNVGAALLRAGPSNVAAEPAVGRDDVTKAKGLISSRHVS
jgi:hypothetical protein